MDRAPICQNGPVLAPYEVGAPSRLRHLVISTLIALALVSHTALTSLHAQTRYPIDDWADTGGMVKLSKSMSATTGMSSLDLDLPSREGESVTYYLRLSKQPAADGWWVRVHVNGVVYIDGVLAEKGISWVPSVGWPININNEDASKPTPWRSVTIYATANSDTDGEPIKITHEVSDEEFNCPPSLHGIAPVTVRIIDSGAGGGDGNGAGGGDGNGAGGGDGNGAGGGDGNGAGGGDGNGDGGGDGNGDGGGDGNGDGGGDGDGNWDGDGDGDGDGDDDPPGLSIDDAPAVREGESAAFVVRLSASSDKLVTVAYETRDGTAVAGADYTSTSGTLRFDAGETRTTLAVPTLEDATAEETEGFTVQLRDPSGATVADGTATGTITDDDDPPGLSIDDAPAVREGESAAFVVRLSASSDKLVTVAYETRDGTAAAGFDYVATEGTLRFDAGETRTTLAVPTLEDATAEETEGFTVQLRDPSGATVADGTATGTITDNAQRRIEVVNDVVLPEVGRALAFSAVRCRIDQVLSGSAPRGTSTELSGHLALSPEARSGQWAAPGVQSPTLVQAFDDSLFLMQSQEEEDGEGRFAAWWCPDYQNLGGGGRGGGITWDGAVSSWHAGADARIGPGLLVGVSFSRSRGSFDYQGGGRNLDAGRGIYALGLVGIHPYLAWSVLPDLDVWGTVGHAWGDLRVVDEAAGNVLTSPATLDSGVVGVSGRLPTRGATTLRLKGEWALAQMNVARASTAFDAATVDMQRLRMGAEVSYHHALSSGASLIPWGEVSLRHDGGDGEIGAGLELGGGLRHQNPEAGVTVEGHGRWLLIHRGTLREWGVGGLVRFAPKAGGRGTSVSLMPTWGDSASGVQQLWERGATDPHLHSAPGARLDAEFGYGFRALRDRSVLTPYVGLSLVGEAARGYRLGGRLAAGQSATVSLEVERRQYLAAARTHALLLRGTLQF